MRENAATLIVMMHCSTLGAILMIFVLHFIGICFRQSMPPKVRSLSGSKATAGNNATNEDALNLITIGLLGGYEIRKVKAFNDRIYLSRYRRSYWLGKKYYYMDNLYYLPTRDTCLYHMDSSERKGLEYEDGTPIYDVIYQCQRYVQYCCGLTCCLNEPNKKLDSPTLF